jgi:flavin-dependent dehydrogenase
VNKVDYDLIIVGGGPSGLRLAEKLSGKGYKIAVFEAEYSDIIGCMVETSTILEAYKHNIRDSELYFRHRVTKINSSQKEVVLEVITPQGSVIECTCKILAACDGVNSITNKTFGNGPRFVAGTEHYFDEVRADVGCFQTFHTHKYGGGMYLCIFHIAPSKVVVASATRELLADFIREHPTAEELRLPQGKIYRRVGGVTALGKGHLVEERVIFLGDAGGGYPWLGGMMYDGAMKSADIACEPIIESLETGEISCLRKYEVTWHEMFGKRFELEGALKAALDRLTDEEIDSVIAGFKGVGSLRKTFIAAAELKN